MSDEEVVAELQALLQRQEDERNAVKAKHDAFFANITLDTWIPAGIAGVDAGLIWIGDPCYVMGPDASSAPASWDVFCDKLWVAEEEATGLEPNYAPQVATSPLGGGIGVCIPSGYGDGAYQVFVKYKNSGWGIRIAEAKIIFFDDAPEEDESGVEDV